MAKYILRLDDASEHMDVEKWDHMKQLLDQYGVKPIFGIIPENRDESLVDVYEKDLKFWDKMNQWVKDGWTPALHGYDHCYITEEGGLNPVNYRSEFAGLPLEQQCEKLRKGYEILKSKGIVPEIFFAPSHTFDENTLKALKKETEIRTISDTIAFDVYYDKDFYFIPQQSGGVRKLPFKVVTFCYHPNVMTEEHFEHLETFLKANSGQFVSYGNHLLKKRNMGLLDQLLKKLYFARREKR